MPALFRPVDTNVGVIAMGGSASVELCRMNVRTGVVTSSLLPSSWTIQVTDNLLKLINWTQENERDKPEFLRMLMAAMDSSGQPTAFLLPSPVNAQGVVVVTLTAATPNDVVLLYVPRTDESGFLLASGGGGGGGPGEDAYARAQITALTDVVAAKADAAALALKADVSALSGKADAAHNHDDRYSLLGHGHAGYALTGHDHDADYAAAAHTHSEYALVAHEHAGYALTDHNHDADYAAAGHNHDADYAEAGHTHAEYAPITYVNDTFATKTHTHPDYLTSADLTAAAYAAGDGLALDATTKTFSTNGTVARLVNPPQSGDAGKGLAFNAFGKLVTAEFALAEDLASISAGIKYKDPVKRIVTALAEIATISGLANGDRVLVNATPAVSSNGIYVKQSAAPGYVRADDFVAGDDASGAYVFVLDADGAGNAASYICNSAPGSDIIGTNALAFVQYGVGKTYTAGAGLTLSATNQFAPDFATTAPAADGMGTAGMGTKVARADHVHPTDLTRAPLNAPAFTGVATYATGVAPATAATGTELVTAKWVRDQGYASGSSSVSSVGAVVQDVTVAGSTAPLTVIQAAGTATLYLKRGEVENTLARGNDTRFNAKPVGAADKGKLAVISAAGAWTTVGVGSSTNNTLTWDNATGLPAWAPAPGLSAYAPIASPSFTGTVTVPAVTDASADTTAATVKYIKDKLISSSLQIASATQLGGVKVGTGLSIDGTGLMSVNFAGYATTASLGSYLLSSTASTTYATTIALNAAIAAVPYDIAGSVFGTLTPTDKPFLFVAPRALKITNTANVNFRALTAGATGSTTFFLYKQAASGGSPVKLGTATFNATNLTGAYVPEVGVTAANLALAAGDYVYLEVGPSVDSAFKTVFFTVGCTVG